MNARATIWQAVCRVEDIPTLGARRIARESGLAVAVFRSASDKVFALLDRCPHKGGPLSQGIVFGESVACPLHNWTIALTDGTREVKLYHAPNSHSSGMLVGYVPDARVLFTADLVSDTFPLIPALASPVHELIRQNGLSVEMIACGHGNVMPYAQLAYVLGK